VSGTALSGFCLAQKPCKLPASSINYLGWILCPCRLKNRLNVSAQFSKLFRLPLKMSIYSPMYDRLRYRVPMSARRGDEEFCKR
jgi:hypothetical protein